MRRRRVEVPADLTSLDRLIKRLGVLLGQQEALTTGAQAELAPLLKQRTELNDRIRTLKVSQGAAAAEIVRAIEDVLAAIYAFVGPRWAELAGRARSFTRASGVLAMRRSSSKKIKITDEAAVIARIQELGLGDRFLNTKITLNKRAMLADPGAATGIAGVEIEQSETFAVTPAESGTARAAICRLVSRRKAS
jgi:phage host-nuclease inhibitor protein Gam